MNSSKYHYIAVTKQNALLAKFLSNHDEDRFSSNCFCNFQTDKKKLISFNCFVKKKMFLEKKNPGKKGKI